MLTFFDEVIQRFISSDSVKNVDDKLIKCIIRDVAGSLNFDQNFKGVVFFHCIMN